MQARALFAMVRPLGDTCVGVMAQMVRIGLAIVSGGVLCVLSVSLCCYRLRELWYSKNGP